MLSDCHRKMFHRIEFCFITFILTSLEFSSQHHKKNIRPIKHEQTMEHILRMQNVPPPPKRFNYKKYLNQLEYGKKQTINIVRKNKKNKKKNILFRSNEEQSTKKNHNCWCRYVRPDSSKAFKADGA